MLVFMLCIILFTVVYGTKWFSGPARACHSLSNLERREKNLMTPDLHENSVEMMENAL